VPASWLQPVAVPSAYPHAQTTLTLRPKDKAAERAAAAAGDVAGAEVAFVATRSSNSPGLGKLTLASVHSPVVDVAGETFLLATGRKLRADADEDELLLQVAAAELEEDEEEEDAMRRKVALPAPLAVLGTQVENWTEAVLGPTRMESGRIEFRPPAAKEEEGEVGTSTEEADSDVGSTVREEK
jgi:hypothetical protein